MTASGSLGISLPKDIFTFPRGARAGTFIHEIFEQLDFSAFSNKQHGQWIAERLQAHGFEAAWRDVVCGMVAKVLNSRLLENNEELKLSAIPARDCMNELGFYFPVRRFSPQTLKQIFLDHAGIDFPHTLPEHLEKLNFSPSRGFMKGFIDLVFQQRGKYYLVDWKSNHLGPDIEDYEVDRLDQVMQESFYYIQYQLYVLALHQYLELRLSSYHYDRDFGGVFYIFCRGVDPKRGVRYGIFYDRPTAAFIDALGRALIPDY
jgi:exodeoxyribonuclease V beta subunit